MKFAEFRKRFYRMINPRDEGFFDLFERQVAVIQRSVPILQYIIRAQTSDCLWEKEVSELEKECDHVTKQIHEKLIACFITPFDREDISHLTKTLDDIMDHIEDAVMSIGVIHDVGNFEAKHSADDSDVKTFLEIVCKSIPLICEGIILLRGMDDIQKQREQMRALEHEADDLYRKVISRIDDFDAYALLRHVQGPVHSQGIQRVLDEISYRNRKKEIIRNLEDAIDKCNEAFVVLSQIYIKHS